MNPATETVFVIGVTCIFVSSSCHITRGLLSKFRHKWAMPPTMFICAFPLMHSNIMESKGGRSWKLWRGLRDMFLMVGIVLLIDVGISSIFMRAVR